MNTMYTKQSQQNFNSPTQQVARFGAHETLMVHEILSDTIDGINQFELYSQHIKDPRLADILRNQMKFMLDGYNNMVNYLHNQGRNEAIPYRQPKSNVTYGLRQPAPEFPNTNVQQMDDRDVASGMLGCAKASAVAKTFAALECSEPTLRDMMHNCVLSSLNMAYETFLYMNERGYYQVPTLQNNTTQTLINSYQAAPMFS